MKSHLKTTDDPLPDGQAQTADCGKELQRAWIQFCWDSLEVGTTLPLNTLAICKDCIWANRAARRRYIYGISEQRLESQQDQD